MARNVETDKAHAATAAALTQLQQEHAATAAALEMEKETHAATAAALEQANQWGNAWMLGCPPCRGLSHGAHFWIVVVVVFLDGTEGFSTTSFIHSSRPPPDCTCIQVGFLLYNATRQKAAAQQNFRTAEAARLQANQDAAEAIHDLERATALQTQLMDALRAASNTVRAVSEAATARVRAAEARMAAERAHAERVRRFPFLQGVRAQNPLPTILPAPRPPFPSDGPVYGPPQQLLLTNSPANPPPPRPTPTPPPLRVSPHATSLAALRSAAAEVPHRHNKQPQ